MSDFLPPDEMSLQAAGEVLSVRLPVRERGVGESDRTYYDTFDGLVHGAGLSVVHERGRMLLLERESGAELVSTRIAAADAAAARAAISTTARCARRCSE